MLKSHGSEEHFNCGRKYSKKDYSVLSRSQRWRREKKLNSFLQQEKICAQEAIAILSKTIKRDFADGPNDENLNTVIQGENISGLSSKDASALKLFYDLTERNINFIRRYIGGIPKT